jgi:hypothetical protein
MTIITPPADKAKRMPQVIREGAGTAGAVPRPAIAGHGAKFSRKKEEAIAALVAHPNVEEAARAVSLSPQTLCKWLKIPAFEAAVNAALQAYFRQALARLQRASCAAVTVLLKVIFDSGAPASVRLRAANRLLRHMKGMVRIGELEGRLRTVKRLREAEREQCRKDEEGTPAAPGKSARRGGHGAKSTGTRQKAIVALLSQRNVEEAARAAGIGVTTLYRWLQEPGFAAEYRWARLAAFGLATARAQQAAPSAVTTLLKIMIDPGASAAEHVRAADLVLEHATQASEEDIEACLEELNRPRQAVGVVLPGGRRTSDEMTPQGLKAA